MNDYQNFIAAKSQLGTMSGFKPLWMPSFLKDFQGSLAEWSIEKGKAEIAADCGMGKSPMAMVWAENVIRKTNKPVMMLTPLLVTVQMVKEGEKFGIQVERSRDGTVHKNITVTNYQKLHLYNPDDFSGVIADESSCLKDSETETQKSVTQFMLKVPYRLLCTATPAPNDYIELLTSAEALGEMGRMDALSTFFKNDENSNHPIWWGARWRFKKHAEQIFWRWVCSWARVCRKPSDLGFEDGEFILPPLHVNETIVKHDKLLPGELFPVQAITLKEQRAERKVTLTERCEAAAKLSEKHPVSVLWCHLNPEGDLLEKIVPGAVQISGQDSDDEKEEKFTAFISGQIKKLITKDMIAAFGLNLQHCAHMTYFPSHSFERYYQSVRRFWRFGQKNPVTVDVITTEGELGVLKNLQRKSEAATKLFDMLVLEANNALKIERKHNRNTEMIKPSWI